MKIIKILFPLFISSLAGFSTTLGALFIFLKINKKNINKFITFSLSFSLSIMIMISITDLIPPSLFNLLTIKNGLLSASFSFLMGIFIIKLLVKFIDKTKNKEKKLYKLGLLNMIALALHNFPEGIVTFLSTYQDFNLGLKLSLAIILHNIPEGISIAIPIYYATKSKFKAIKYAFLSGLSEPIGAILSFLFLKNFITNELISIILLLVSGIMITISIEEIYPETLKYKEKRYILIGIISGIFLIIINHLFF